MTSNPISGAEMVTAQPVVVMPIQQIYPQFTGVPEPVPEQLKGVVGPELWMAINSANSFTIRQHVKLMPKHCCKWPPCAPQANTYSVYAGLDGDSRLEVLRADEVSDGACSVTFRTIHCNYRLSLLLLMPSHRLQPMLLQAFSSTSSRGTTVYTHAW